MSYFRVVTSPSQTLQVPFKKKTNFKLFLNTKGSVSKAGGAAWGCSAPTPVLSAHRPWDPCIAAICMLWGNSKATCRFGTWNQEKHLNLFCIPLEVRI